MTVYVHYCNNDPSLFRLQPSRVVIKIFFVQFCCQFKTRFWFILVTETQGMFHMENRNLRRSLDKGL
jgi:hypothetical protein